MRTIKLKLTSSANPVSIETSATYLKEFKNEPAVQALKIDWNAVKLIDKGSKTSLELEESLLPAGDAYLFVFPTKTNSGAEYEAMSYGDLRKECARLLPKGTVSATPTRQAMIYALNSLNAIPVVEPKNAAIEIPEVPQAQDDVILYDITTSETLTDDYNSIKSQLSGVKR